MRPSPQRGFTLVEIMIVVALLGLSVTLGLPSFVHAARRQGMVKAQMELVTACQDARRQAILQNSTADLVIHPLQGTFGVTGVNDQSQFPDNVAIEILGVNFIQYEKAEEAHVHFQPNGTSDEFTIVLHSTENEYVKIYLDTVTALPQVENLR